MKNTNPSPKLTDEQIRDLAETICRDGDEPKEKCIALLLLVDEITRRGHLGADVAWIAKRAAFARYSDYDEQLIDAQIQLLRSELK